MKYYFIPTQYTRFFVRIIFWLKKVLGPNLSYTYPKIFSIFLTTGCFLKFVKFKTLIKNVFEIA